MFIYKPSKIILYQKIKKYSLLLKGITVDAGSGKFDQYSYVFPNITKLITVDNNSDNNPNILSSIDDMPIGNQSVDSILCFQVIGDLRYPENAIKEFNRILKANGTILLSESFINELHDEPCDFWRFTKYGLMKLFENNGFEVLNIEQIGGFWAVKAQINIRYLINRFDLYNNLLFNIVLSPLILLYGKFMLIIDKWDSSTTNKQFAIGWLVVAKKII